MNLYPWQEECLERWLSNHGRGIVQAVTGAGKTHLALAAVERLQKQLNCKRPGRLQVKIVVPTSSLMHQWNRALREFLQSTAANNTDSANIHDLIGMRGGGYQTPVRPYMIYVINSARYELARQILADMQNGDPVLLIADECHHYTSGQNSLIFEFLPYLKEYPNQYFALGLSATLPSAQSQDILTAALGRKIYHFSLSQAAAQRSICPYDVFHVALSFAPEERDNYMELTDRLTALYRRLLSHAPQLQNMNLKEQYELLRALSGSKNTGIAETASLYIKLSYKRKSLICLAAARIECACRLIRLLPCHAKILVFGERIRQAEELYRLLLPFYPGKVGRYHSQMSPEANKNTLQRFRDGEIRILITCKSLDEGLNIPDASIGIILSGTSVQRQRIQRLGRIIRQKEGKHRAALYYLHITDTAEDRCFLPDMKECRISELEYHTSSGQFTNTDYDQAASRLLGNLQETTVSPEILEELVRNLHRGKISLDWLEPTDNITARIREAENVAEKNYWICMKLLAERR